MNFLEYKNQAITTRIYSPKVAIPYVVLGLVGETGEYIEKAFQAEQSTEENLKLVRKEQGDQIWYLAAIHTEFELPEIIDFPQPTVDLLEREKAPFEFFIEMGKIAEQVKKYLRDDWKEDESVEISENRKEKIFEAWKNCLQRWVDLLALMGFDLQKTIKENLDKLAKRKEEGKISGSGDLR